MKPITLFLFGALLLSACSRYQYAVIDSNVKNDGHLVFENDSVKITYRFSGNNGPATVRIHNKLSAPLYVNWQRSSLIIEGESVSRVPESSPFHATGSTTNILGWASTTTAISGTLQQQALHGFIPPDSYIQSQPVYLSNGFSRPSVNMKDARTLPGQNAVIRYKDFGPENSPLAFRSYITLSTAPDFSNPVVFDHKFWVDEVFETVGSADAGKHFGERGDVYYTSKASKGGYTAGLLLLIISMGLLAAGSAP